MHFHAYREWRFDHYRNYTWNGFVERRTEIWMGFCKTCGKPKRKELP